MTETSNYQLKIVEGTDKVNPLVDTNPNFEKIDTVMKANQTIGVQLATEEKSGKVHAITYTNTTAKVFRFTATSDYAKGDSFTVNGTSCTAVTVSGRNLPEGAFVVNSSVLCILEGTKLTVVVPDISPKSVQDLIAPVGYIFEWASAPGAPDLTSAQKVADYFGFGTWEEYGKGRVLVGADSTQTEFATPGTTGGETKHTLTIEEMPEHSHEMRWSNEGAVGTGNGVLIRDSLTGGSWPYGYWTGKDGGNSPHNNLQPYIVVYRWRRIA